MRFLLKLSVIKPPPERFSLMTKPRRIYILSPKNLSAETIAVAFAKTSRSPEPFDVIADELTDEKSAKFHEKWVVGYGHASVAEHAVLHIALENVSRLAIETIEGNRLASYTEKSTRYQQWDSDAFFIPEELQGHGLEQKFTETCTSLFHTYQTSIPKVMDWLRQTQPQETDESDKAYSRRLNPMAVDICRFLLPAASLANVGITINARALEYAICKMLSSELAEVRAIGKRLREVGKLETPTLIKYAACNDYLVSIREKMLAYGENISEIEPIKDFQLVSWNKNGENEILAAILFRFGQSANYNSCLQHVLSLSEVQKKALTEEIMLPRGKFDQPLREFEYGQMTFEVIMDQGAYFEFKRHRMMTQTVQPLKPDLGFTVPKGISDSGCEADYRVAMHQAANLYQEIAALNPDAASYIVPNGFNRRVLFTLNLRQAFHFCRLRAAKNAHFSIRRIAHHMAEQIKQIYPLLGNYLDIPSDETWQSIEEENFSAIRTR
jgi:thymidylate synthase ThyX